MGRQVTVPRPSLARLPVYYRRVLLAVEDGDQVISSQKLGDAAGVPAAQVRKDLGYLGELGRAGVGYDSGELAMALQDFLGLATDKEAIVAGAGNLGRALVSYPGFRRYGLRIVALFDNDMAKIGTGVEGMTVLANGEMPDLVRRLQIKMGIVAVPAEQAQATVDLMIDSGISVVWNFAPQRLCVPDHVLLESEDLATRLATLSYHMMRQRSLSNVSTTQYLPASR